MKNKIIAIVGMPAAGKTVTTDYMLKKGMKKVYFGDCTFDEIEKQGLEINHENEKKTREFLRKKHGPGAFAILSMPKVEALYKKGDVIIESMYSWDEYKMVRDKFGDALTMVTIFANPKLRHDRLAKRVEYKNGKKRVFTLDEAQDRDIVQLENLFTGGPIAIADHVIVNESTFDDLYKGVDQMIAKFKVNIPIVANQENTNLSV